MTAYYNIHGQPLNVSAKDAVRAVYPGAAAYKERTQGHPLWQVLEKAKSIAGFDDNDILGTGATEESAWRDAWSRMLADDVAKEGAK